MELLGHYLQLSCDRDQPTLPLLQRQSAGDESRMHTFAGGMTDAEGEMLHVMTTVQAFDLVAETGMVGRGRHALRSAARMDSLQKLSVRQAADTPVSQPSSVVELVWPIAAKQRCYALLRQVRQTSVDQSRPNTPQEAPAGAVRSPPVVWPLAVKEHIRRLRRAESTGGPQQNTVKAVQCQMSVSRILCGFSEHSTLWYKHA